MTTGLHSVANPGTEFRYLIRGVVPSHHHSASNYDKPSALLILFPRGLDSCHVLPPVREFAISNSVLG